MKKQLLLTLSIFLGFSIYSFAQITFQKTYGGTNDDEAKSVQQTTDGGYIIAGYTKSFGAAWDVYLIKTNSSGDTLWTRTFGGTYIDEGFSVQQTTDGGYIVAGITDALGTGSIDIYLIKTDTNGNLLWTKTFGGTYGDESYFVQQTTDDGYIITGYTNLFGAGAFDVYLIKTDANGDSLWTRTFGGISEDYGYAVQQTADSGYIIIGETGSFGGYDAYLIKTDVNGDLLWSKTFGGAGEYRGYSVHQTTDGGYIIAGWLNNFGPGVYDVFLIKTDINGDSLWTKTFGGTDHDFGYSVQQTTDGEYIIAGTTGSFGAGYTDIYLIKTDTNGDTLWTKTINGWNQEKAYSIEQTSDGGFIIAGSSVSYGAGFRDVYLIKTDVNGNSGCNQGNVLTNTPTSVTHITSPATIVTSVTSIITTPTTIVGSGGIVSTPCTSVGINDVKTVNSFFIFPNPSSGKLTISFEKTIIKGKVEILNILGEKVFTNNIFNESKKEIKLEDISRGIYFVKVLMEKRVIARN